MLAYLFSFNLLKRTRMIPESRSIRSHAISQVSNLLHMCCLPCLGYATRRQELINRPSWIRFNVLFLIPVMRRIPRCKSHAATCHRPVGQKVKVTMYGPHRSIFPFSSFSLLPCPFLHSWPTSFIQRFPVCAYTRRPVQSLA